MRSCSNEFGRITSEIFDMEEFFKFVHRKLHPGQYEDMRAKVVHQPIDWSKYQQSSYIKPSELRRMSTGSKHGL